jgi:hypothetical protein
MKYNNFNKNTNSTLKTIKKELKKNMGKRMMKKLMRMRRSKKTIQIQIPKIRTAHKKDPSPSFTDKH